MLYPGDMTCSVPGCGRGGKIRRGWCNGHWQRWRKGLDVNVPLKERRKPGEGTLNRGYVMKRDPETKKLRGEHCLVMEQMLGRRLIDGENVHHKNGVRHDNRPENLELWVTTQPKGQRPEDLVEWAEEILRRYA